MLLQHGLHQVRFHPEVGGDQSGHPGGPVQQGVAHGAGDLVDGGIGGRHIEEPGLLLVEGQTAGFDLQRQFRNLQAGKGRAVTEAGPSAGAGAARPGRRGTDRHTSQGGSHGIGGLDQAAAGLLDIPLTVRLADNAARGGGLAQGGLGDADPAGSLAGGRCQFRHAATSRRAIRRSE